ncbi:MAG: FAD-dependent oxidoreductase [Candidatus Thermoplasmatota archaeon]|nr:FAD-dependent oxidoreductase [Candidatus Thermoplasmatota archaeon]
MRIQAHPIIDFKKRKKIPFYYQKKRIIGEQGDTIASALHAAGIKTLTTSLKYGSPRGFFCGIGKCSSCLMRVNGVPNVRTCIVPLKEGIIVEMQDKLATLPDAKFKGVPKKTLTVDVLVVGAGPAGLCAALESVSQGASVLLVDENQCVGGQLIKQTHKFFGSKQERAGTRGIDIAKELENDVRSLQREGKIQVMTEATVIGYYESENKHRFGVVERCEYQSTLYDVRCDAVILACGAMENMLLFPGNDLPGVYGAGAVQTLMNVYGVKPGKRVLMVGAGNVGLIVSYQLLQAGIAVDRVVEAAPVIGGYNVHAAKLRRCGVPILVSHSIKEVCGENSVEGAVVVQLDDQWKPIDGSEEYIKCDTICLAVGLTPSTRLLSQIGVQLEFIPEAGGYVALHDTTMQTSVKGVYVAGDASGIEEASTAMIEGKIAGLAAAIQLGRSKNKKLLTQYHKELGQLRAGPFGEKPRIAKEKIAHEKEKHHA